MENEKTLERWHGAHHYRSRIHFLFVIFLFFSLGVIIWSYVEINKVLVDYASFHKPTPIVKLTPTPTKEPVVCTMEALACPDGSYVARHGPNCEFDACPGAHCGGFIANAKTCSNGYHCQLDSKIPDVGGTCIKN